jgi:hypothetical protein
MTNDNARNATARAAPKTRTPHPYPQVGGTIDHREGLSRLGNTTRDNVKEMNHGLEQQ